MVFFDNKTKVNYVQGRVDLEDFYKILNGKLGNKYTVKLVKKGNFGQQMINGLALDHILVIKNAYHRTIITVSDYDKETVNAETVLNFEKDTVKWWINIALRGTGIIGSGALALIYGNGEKFNEDIFQALKSDYEIKTREHNLGIATLFK